MAPESIPAYSTFRGRPVGHAYNEAAFHYFLAAERSRVQRSRRSMILVLVSLRPSPGRSEHLTDATASMIFAGLAAAVREVDFVGWYWQGRVAGAVLPQAAGSSSELRALILQRILTTLKSYLPPDATGHLHVRAVRLGRKEHPHAF
jgi:hypothetical protein